MFRGLKPSPSTSDTEITGRNPKILILLLLPRRGKVDSGRDYPGVVPAGNSDSSVQLRSIPSKRFVVGDKGLYREVRTRFSRFGPKADLDAPRTIRVFLTKKPSRCTNGRGDLMENRHVSHEIPTLQMEPGPSRLLLSHVDVARKVNQIHSIKKIYG